MYYHLLVAIAAWITALTFPSLSDTFMATFAIFGFIAFLLFIKAAHEQLNHQFLLRAEEAENEILPNLSSFKGTFVEIRDEQSSFSNEFTYLVFHNGEIEIPLFCRSLRVIQKAAQSEGEVIIYYKDYILVEIEEVEKEPFISNAR